MPQTVVYFYREADGKSPVLDWLAELRLSNSKGFAHCLAKLRLLRMSGFELRRPAADYLRDGIYELRAKQGTIQYRMLYFFHGRNIAVVAHGLTKEKAISPADMDRAILRRKHYEKDPAKHRSPESPEEFGSTA